MRNVEDYAGHWDEKFRTRAWGRYPPEDLVRFMGRNFRNADKNKIRVLEVGCGPGANVWFLHREGFAVAAIDISPTAIELTGKRLSVENQLINSPTPDLKVGNFMSLPWQDNTFDVVIDIFSIYSNTREVITKTLLEIQRVLKPGGFFYTKLWGTQTTGFGTGTSLEHSTFDDITSGPCCNMGVTHFFARNEVEPFFNQFFTPIAIDSVLRTDVTANQQIEEFHCQFRKAK
jgi:ubiquinone/menaquinone biosynthesis C-methylase UbiE